MISDSNEELQQQLEYTVMKPDCHSWWILKMQSGREDTLEERYVIKLCFKLGKNATETCGMLQIVLEHLAWIEHQLLSGIRDSRKAGSLWGMIRSVRGVRKSIDQSWLGKGVGLGLLRWGFKGVQERFRRKRSALFKSGQWHFHQDNALVPNSILVTNYLIKIGIKTVPHPPSSPCDFWIFPKLWDNWGDERGCDEGHWHAHTRGLPWGLPEVVGTVEQVHCSRRRLLR